MTSCNCKIKPINFDYGLIRNDLYGTYEMVIDETNQIYGSVEYIHKTYDEPKRTYILREREIYFKEALKFMFQLSLMNIGSFIVP